MRPLSLLHGRASSSDVSTYPDVIPALEDVLAGDCIGVGINVSVAHPLKQSDRLTNRGIDAVGLTWHSSIMWLRIQRHALAYHSSAVYGICIYSLRESQFSNVCQDIFTWFIQVFAKS